MPLLLRFSRNHRARGFVLLGKMHPIFSWSWVESQSALAAQDWHSCAGRSLPRAPFYAPLEQRHREQAFDDCLRSVEQELHAPPRTQADRTAFQDRLVAAFARFAAAALDLEPSAIELITHGFLPAGAEFARRSRRFDSALTMSEIFQACRNAWTVYGLQPLLGEPSCITPSIVGYSLLYPYTDNDLDRVDTSAQAKRSFCARFRQRLRGEGLPAQNHREAAIWALVAMIESQYLRAQYPQVFDSLLAIHQAQEESIAQLGPGLIDGRASTCDKILQISFAKGGSSVLADACLAQGWLNRQESQAAFYWGALLQLGDDLQDIHEDLRRGSATLFTLAAAEGIPLDSLVAQLLHFSRHVGAELDRFPAGTAALKDLLRMSWRSLIVAAVANAPEFFSGAFLRELERSSPFRFAFLRSRHRKLASRRGLCAAVFNALIDAPETGETLPLSFDRCFVSPAAY